MRLSVISTMYRSASFLPDFYQRVTNECQRITDDYEIFFVNDGSPDESREVSLALYHADSHVRVIDLSRNFGHHKAIQAGLNHALGELIFLIDCDLEEPPELLGTFYEALQSHLNIDIIYGVQEQRKGKWFESVTGQFYYKLFNLMADVKMPENQLVARLMTFRYIQALLNHHESELTIAELCALNGFEQLALTVHKGSRGESSYTLTTKLYYMIKSIVFFSNRPLIFISVLGGLITLVAFVIIGYMISVFLLFGRPPEGYSSLIVSIWFVGGLTIFSVGILALYLSITLAQIKH